MTIRLLPKIFAVVRAIRLGVPDADWVATTLNPKFEGYLDRAPKQNAKGVTQVALFVFGSSAKTCGIAVRAFGREFKAPKTWYLPSSATLSLPSAEIYTRLSGLRHRRGTDDIQALVSPQPAAAPARFRRYRHALFEGHYPTRCYPSCFLKRPIQDLNSNIAAIISTVYNAINKVI